MSPRGSQLPDDDDALAGLHALGLVEGAERDALERRIVADEPFGSAVERWRQRLHPIDAAAEPIDPSLELWPRIEAEVAALVPERRPARVVTPASLGSRLADWWQDLRVMQRVAGAAALASLLLAIGLGVALDRARRQPTMIAVLLTDTNVAAAVVHTYRDGRVEMLPLQSIAVPEGRALEIWTLWDRQVGPRSVGLIDRARTTPLRLDDLPLGTGQLFEITLEPAAGSPNGRPTGPIIAKGITAQRL